MRFLFTLPVFVGLGLLFAVLLTLLVLFRIAREIFLHFFWPAARQSPPWYHLKEGAGA